LQNRQVKKVRLQKTSSKKSSMPWHCQIATRLVFAWCGCNLVNNRRLQHPLHVVATADVQQLQNMTVAKPECGWLLAPL
jgi:hypothetical protein